MKRILSLLLSILAIWSMSGSITIALSDNDLNSIYNDTTYYDPLSTSCGDTSSVAAPVSGSKQTIFIGDSLTVAMSRASLLTKASTAGLTLDTTSAETPDKLSDGSNTTRVSGPSIEATNGINIASTLPKLAAIPTITNAGIIVIGLGTNREEDMGTRIDSFIEEIRRLNTTNPTIYWVNTYFTAQTSVSFETRNETIASAAARKNFKVIDFATEAIAKPDTYPFQTDGTHHSGVGDANKADFVLSKVTGANSVASPPTAGAVTLASASGYDPLSLRYPSFTNESEVIAKLKTHITERYGNSPFAKNLQYVDSIFQQSKDPAININPLLVLSIAQQENGYGKSGSTATDSEHNNYFGITQGSGYRKFSTVAEGIRYFIEKISRHVTTPDGNYVNVRTFYEYISVHQSGVLAYPGEYPPESAGDDKTPQYLSGDPRMGGVLVSWDPAANANTPAPYTNTIYNPGIYYKNSIALINKITGSQLSDIPSRNGSSSIVSGCGAPSAGFIGSAPGQYTKVIDGFVIYQQSDPTWGSEAYGDGINADGEARTIASSGCGPSAMAMIISTLTGKTVTPSDTSKFGMLPGSKTTASTGGSDGVPLAELMAPNWGLKATFVGADKEKINATLKAGGYVIVSGRGGLPFSEGGHFVVIRAVTPEGKWLVGDSSHRTTVPNTSTVAYDPDTMISEFTAGGYSSYAITK